MKKITVWMITIVLIFSGLTVFEAETSVGYENPAAKCEEQLESGSEESGSEEESAVECEEQQESDSEEQPVTEGEKQPEPDGEENSVTEGEEQSESDSEQDPTVEGEEQPTTEEGDQPTTEGEEESNDKENPIAGCEEPAQSDSEENPATEGEEQLELNSEKDLEADCEEEPASEEKPEIECEEGFYIEEDEQLESDSEEELAAEGDEQLESDSEGELAAEGDEQLEPDSEEELAIEGDEQLANGSEEELATKGEEKLESDSEEQLAIEGEKRQAPKCKRDMPSPGMLIKDVGPVGNINFEDLGLDSPGELDEFTQMNYNLGLEFPVQGESKRKHYMYFGDAYNYRTAESMDDPYSYQGYANNDDWYRPLPRPTQSLESVVNERYIRAQNFQVLLTMRGSIKNDHVASYLFSHGRPWASGYPKGSGLVIAHGDHPGDIAKFQSQSMPLLKLFKNEKTHELIGYAAVINGTYVDGYLKIKMSPVGTKGRINVSMKYLKLSDEYAYTNFAYSVHMDIAKRHTDSKIYSLGNKKGFYFHEKRVYDGRDYVLYFFRDGYKNHPEEFKATNSPIHYPFFDGHDPDNEFDFYYTLNGSGTEKDPGHGALYEDFQKHPGWALRWEPEVLKPNDSNNGIREVNLELAVTSQLDMPEMQLDDDHGYTEDGGYRIGGTWNAADSKNIRLYYTIDGNTPEKFGDYENLNAGTKIPWKYTIPSDVVEEKLEENLDHDITIYAIDEYGRESNIETIKFRPTLAITEQVFDQDGNELKEVAPGETLRFEILVDPNYISKDTGTYGEVKITQTYDPQLKSPPINLKITDENGDEIDEIGTVMFNTSNNEIVAKPGVNLPRSKKVKVTFNAEVQEEASEGENVVGQAKVTGTYSTGDEVDETSNKVDIKISGVLKFVSAPQTISFGDKLTISPRKKTYYPIPISLDESLAVKDSRSQSRNPSWTMTAKLKQPLMGKDTQSTLDSFRYSYGGNVSSLSEDASVLIYNQKTTNSEVVNISNKWKPDGDGLYLEVLPGTARADIYKGTVMWTLHDVPLSE